MICGAVAALDRQDLLVAGMRQQVRLASAARQPRAACARPCSITSAAEDEAGSRSAMQPPPVLLDADRDGFVALLVEVLDDGGGRCDRHFVLARSAAVDDADA